MTLLILVGLVVAGYFWFTGKLSPKRIDLVIGIAAGLLSARFVASGQPLLAALVGGAAALFLGTRRVAGGASGEVARARALLGVGVGASVDEIRAAHRRLAAAAHPDRGGKVADMQALNAARDLLLARAPGAER